MGSIHAEREHVCTNKFLNQEHDSRAAWFIWQNQQNRALISLRFRLLGERENSKRSTIYSFRFVFCLILLNIYICFYTCHFKNIFLWINTVQPVQQAVSATSTINEMEWNGDLWFVLPVRWAHSLGWVFLDFSLLWQSKKEEFMQPIKALAQRNLLYCVHFALWKAVHGKELLFICVKGSFAGIIVLFAIAIHFGSAKPKYVFHNEIYRFPSLSVRIRLLYWAECVSAMDSIYICEVNWDICRRRGANRELMACKHWLCGGSDKLGPTQITSCIFIFATDTTSSTSNIH